MIINIGLHTSRSSIARGDWGSPMIFKKQGRPVCLVGVSSFSTIYLGDPISVFTPAYGHEKWIKWAKWNLSSNRGDYFTGVEDFS